MTRRVTRLTVLMLLASGSMVATGCGSIVAAQSANGLGVVRAVGAESQYANVIAQIGGRYVSVTDIINNPNLDPHTYEASPRDAIAVAKATLIVQNGVGYDSFMDNLESASPDSGRVVINVGKALGYGATIKNPHLWYSPQTMPVAARLIDQALTKQMPAHRAYFSSRLATFDQSLNAWHEALTRVKRGYGRAPVAVTEPVADYLLAAAGLTIKTPWAFQAAIMNGTDPSPQDVQIEEDLLRHNRVKVFVYNQQAVDSTTSALLAVARKHQVPVVGVYETMPSGYSYQGWMTVEVKALEDALQSGKSTVKLP